MIVFLRDSSMQTKELEKHVMITTYKAIESKILKLQKSKSKTKLEIKTTFSSNYDEMNYLRQSQNFLFEEDPFSVNAQSVAIILHETLLLK